uniref:Uncharacterized protein n=1 Tax=viral metagenome TaxID=1070528 RepID=A0A6C0C371_9ZZZZ
MELYRKIIYRVLKCKKDYEPINYDDEFIKYMNLTNEMSNNETTSDYDYTRAKNVFLDICIHKNNCEFEDKFGFYKDKIQNPFISDKQRLYIESIFCEIQKCYFRLLRFRELFKHKYYKTQINVDMGFTELNENDKNVISIVQNKKKYLFKITDLFKLLNDKMTLGNDYFITSSPIKNPYNNILFSKADLYNFYFKMKFDTLYFNEVLHQFFKVNFNIYEFQEHNMTLLKENMINDKVRNMSSNILYQKILKMIEFINNEIYSDMYKLCISSDFDKKIVIDAFTPYYRLYLLMNYSNDFFKINYYESLFFYKMKKFILHNNRFGRMKNSYHYNKSRRTAVDDKYINFYEEEQKEEFNENHVQIIKRKRIYETVFKRDAGIFRRASRIINSDSSDSEDDDGINVIVNNNNNINNDLVDTESESESNNSIDTNDSD